MADTSNPVEIPEPQRRELWEVESEAEHNALLEVAAYADVVAKTLRASNHDPRVYEVEASAFDDLEQALTILAGIRGELA